LELYKAVERDQMEMARAEKAEVEEQLKRMCGQQKETRAEMDAIKEGIKLERAEWERERKAAEMDKNGMKSRLEGIEQRERDLEGMAQKNGENMARRVAEMSKEMAENEAKMGRMEAELGQAKVAEEAEMRKAKRWREELAAERDRLRDLLARLRSVCLMAIRSSGTDEAGRFCLEPTCSLDDDVQLIGIIDDLLMKALCSARREADALRIQQQKQIRELDDLKRDILGLRRTGNELNASDDKLLMENKNIKEQVQ
jgi:hypothetical protein